MPEPLITNEPRAVPGEVTTFQVAARYLEDVACDLADLRLADMFASTGDAPTLRLVWANDTPGQAGYVITETRVDDGRPYPALSDIAPAAFVEECEIYQQFGIRPATGREPDRIMVTWPRHRGLEWRLPGKRPREALFLAERAERLSAVAAGWAFAAAVEAAIGTRVPAEAARTRAVALELERLYNHAAAMVALCQATGLTVGRAAAEIALERLLRLNTQAFGHRYLIGVIKIGGVSRGPDAGAIRRELSGACGEFRRAASALLRTGSFAGRLDATGTVTRGQASYLGLVGPVARAAGLTTDARQVSGGPYDNGIVVATGKAGDVLARFNVMLAEAAESVRLIGEFLAAGTAVRTADLSYAAGTGLGWAESPRGEALAWVSLDDDGRITRARLRPASARNWRVFDDAYRSRNAFTDIPVIEASFGRRCQRACSRLRRAPGYPGTAAGR